MITCCEKYEIDPSKIPEIEHFACLWIPLVERHGGRHHGYFLPSEPGATTAYSLYSFNNREALEAFREKAATDRECKAALWYLHDRKLIIETQQTYLTPFF